MEPLNLVFIMSDEHNARTLGCYGHGIVKTPHIDALAASGARFTAAYTNCPICVPARASFATGRYAHETGYWDNAHPYDGRVPGWGHRLQATGHRVVSIGKLHYRNTTDPTGLDAQILPMHVKDGKGDLAGALRAEMPPKTATKGLAEQLGPGDSSVLRYDRQIAERACAWIAEAGGREGGPPWVLFVSFLAPHYPLVAPPAFYAMYPAEEMPLPEPKSADDPSHHPWVRAIRKAWPYDDYMDEEKRRVAVASYFGMCSFMDANVGAVLGAIEAAGLSDRTRVVYASDHGESLGKRGIWGKSTLYEESAAVPLVLAGPDVPRGGVCRTAVSLADAYPTILNAVGEEPAGEEKRELPGESLFDIAASADDPGRAVFSEYHAAGAPTGGYMLRRGRYKYIHYAGFAPELFDLENDPQEAFDLAREPGYTALIQEFESALRVVVDPEAADKKARADQAALVERYGGREAVLSGGGYFGSPTPMD